MVTRVSSLCCWQEPPECRSDLAPSRPAVASCQMTARDFTDRFALPFFSRTGNLSLNTTSLGVRKTVFCGIDGEHCYLDEIDTIDELVLTPLPVRVFTVRRSWAHNDHSSRCALKHNQQTVRRSGLACPSDVLLVICTLIAAGDSHGAISIWCLAFFFCTAAAGYTFRIPHFLASGNRCSLPLFLFCSVRS